MRTPRRRIPGLSIAAVSRQTGIPATTLRFYEKELPLLFRLRKTRGGHRRYGPSDVLRFQTIRRLTETEGVKLADVRRILASSSDPDPLRDELEACRRMQADHAQWLGELENRVAKLEERIDALASGRPRRRGWLLGGRARKP